MLQSLIESRWSLWRSSGSEFQSNVLLLKKTKEEYLRMEKTLRAMEQENRKLFLKLKDTNALLKSVREEDLSDVRRNGTKRYDEKI